MRASEHQKAIEQYVRGYEEHPESEEEIAEAMALAQDVFDRLDREDGGGPQKEEMAPARKPRQTKKGVRGEIVPVAMTTWERMDDGNSAGLQRDPPVGFGVRWLATAFRAQASLGIAKQARRAAREPPDRKARHRGLQGQTGRQPQNVPDRSVARRVAPRKRRQACALQRGTHARWRPNS